MERTVLISGQDRLEAHDFQTALEMEPQQSSKESLPLPGGMTMEEIEKAMILKVLDRYAGNISKAAESLGLSRPALYRRLEKYGIES